MTRGNHVLGSGDGSRPTTDGTVDNIGAGEAFVPKDKGKHTSGEVSKPAPAERMAGKRKNVEATKADGSDAFGLHEDLETETNEETPPPPPKPRP
ncbi:hypothetical protein [Variovorax sp. EBFNA2]|uniref:hypothetical protein n=1 Tax=Variovorax sp. EBFNA2 TaxID=3342097 RepID=UPI0029BFF487|nr:hypothetical protein [Variovorax boronicumulans]WPG40192.1 hypothetical protein RZE79_12835 [Variovorax boronicumulans]